MKLQFTSLNDVAFHLQDRLITLIEAEQGELSFDNKILILNALKAAIQAASSTDDTARKQFMLERQFERCRVITDKIIRNMMQSADDDENGDGQTG